VIVSSDLDGIHLEASEHERLGQTVAARVREVLGERLWLWVSPRHIPLFKP